MRFIVFVPDERGWGENEWTENVWIQWRCCYIDERSSEINPLLFSPLRLSFDSLLLLETEKSFLYQNEVLETKESRGKWKWPDRQLEMTERDHNWIHINKTSKTQKPTIMTHQKGLITRNKASLSYRRMDVRGKPIFGIRTKAVPFLLSSSSWKEEERMKGAFTPLSQKREPKKHNEVFLFPSYPSKRPNQSVDERTLLKTVWRHFDDGFVHFTSPKNRCKIFSPPTRVSQRITPSIFSRIELSEVKEWMNAIPSWNCFLWELTQDVLVHEVSLLHDVSIFFMRKKRAQRPLLLQIKHRQRLSRWSEYVFTWGKGLKRGQKWLSMPLK